MTTVVIHPATIVSLDYGSELEREHGVILEANGSLMGFQEGIRAADVGKIEGALEWAATAAFLDHNRWRIHGDLELFVPGGCADALIALHERSGK